MSKVYIAGAGPGNPEFLTRKVYRLIQTCDVILYDALIDPILLSSCKPSCEKIYVGKRSGHHSMKQDEINQLLIEKANQGKVLRLKGGDPFVFGRGPEECMALKEAGIDYEVLPGITSAISVPEAVGIPVTYRKESRSLTIVTGHTVDGNLEDHIDFESLAHLKGTIVFLMGLHSLPIICRELMKYGLSKDTPISLISNGTYVNECVLRSTLEKVQEDIKKEPNIVAPTIIVIGYTAGLDLRTPILHPLDKVMVSVIGTASFCEKLAIQIEDLGGRVDMHADVKMKAMEKETLKQVFDEWDSYTYLVFTGKNAITYFFEQYPLDIRKMCGLKIIPIGPGTSEYLHTYHLYEDKIPEVYTSDGLANVLIQNCTSKDRVLIPRAKKGNDVLSKKLKEHGISYTELAVYDSVFEKTSPILGDYVVFGSAQGVHGFMQENGQIPKKSIIICIGPYTKQALDMYKVENKICVAQEATTQGIVKEIVKEVENESFS